MAFDVTSHKQTERILTEKEEQMRAIVENAFDGILIADAEPGNLFLETQPYVNCWVSLPKNY